MKPGQTFTKGIGRGLVFALRPLQDGSYTVSVEPEKGDTIPPDDFTRCVTMPAHGPVATDIQPAQFVDSTPPNSDDQFRGVREREFNFVTNARDQKRACDELDVVLYVQPKSGKDGQTLLGTPGYQPPPLGKGWLHIEPKVRTGSNGQPEFESLWFEARVEFPIASKEKKAR